MKLTSEISLTANASILKFILKRENLIYLTIGIGSIISSFFIFKLLYPYPDFFSDSTIYIFAAQMNLNVSLWPIGYSKFLYWVHLLTHSDLAVVAMQYFLMQLSALSVFFGLSFFYSVSKTNRNILFYFIILNPLSLYICNTINSDALFAALSLLWISTIIWIINRPSWTNLISHSVLLFLCFTIRNNAYYYPIVSLFVLLVSKKSKIHKLSGFALLLIPIIIFVSWTKREMLSLTGTKQYNLFTGWQLANNALYIYDQIQVDSNSLPTPQTKEINRITINWLKRIDLTTYRSTLNNYVGNIFIKEPDAPLKQYFKYHKTKGDTSALGYIKDWGRISADFKPFGTTIIEKHPISYMSYFIIPNVWHYFMPPLSHLELYNYGLNTVDPIERSWFHYTMPEIHVISHSLQGGLLIYSGLFLFLNLYFICYGIKLLMKPNKKDIPLQIRKSISVVSLFLALNFVFSVSTTINILRYQIVPMYVLVVAIILMSDVILNNKKNAKSPSFKSMPVTQSVRF